MKQKIAVTGGIGSGKSTVIRYLKELGYPVFSCDELYKEVIVSTAYIEKISLRFPTCVKDGKVDRRSLASWVFKNEKERLALNAIAHPLIMQLLHSKMDERSESLVFAEVPLLFEGNYQNQFDKVIVVLRDSRLRIAAVAQRDAVSVWEVERRIAAQFDYFSKEAKVIFDECNAQILYNDGTEEELKEKINKALSTWT